MFCASLFNGFFVKAHPAGAINVQIYRLIKEWTAWDIARRAAFAFFGIFSGTEENPEFIQSKTPRIFFYLIVPILNYLLSTTTCISRCRVKNS